MSELVTDRIRTHAERLRLTHIAETADALIERAEKSEMGYREFLDLALEDEVGVREGRRFRNALKRSRACRITRDSMSSTSPSSRSSTPARSRTSPPSHSWSRRPTCACWGLPGSARRCPGVGLSIAACQAGYSIYFTTLDDMVRNLKGADASGRFAKKLRTNLKPAVLIVDEVGYLPLSRAEGDMVFQVVSRRYERGSIILTSNKSFSEMGQVFGDDVLATAILDRLLHHSEVISINGPSYRLKDRLKPEGGDAS